MKSVLLCALLIIVAVVAAETPDAAVSNDVIRQVIKLLEGVKETAAKFPLLGESITTIIGALIIILKGLSLIVALFETGGALFGLLKGDLSSVTTALGELGNAAGGVLSN